MKDITILLVEDHKLIRVGIKTLFDEAEGYSVTGEAQDGKTAIVLAEKLNPDIIILDSLMAFSDYDENKSKEMGELMKYLMQTARINDIAIVPVHHTRKRRLNERKAAQDMDEMIGSNMMQRYTRRIIGLQPKGQMIVEEVTGDEPVIVRDLKNNLTKKFRNPFRQPGWKQWTGDHSKPNEIPPEIAEEYGGRMEDRQGRVETDEEAFSPLND